MVGTDAFENGRLLSSRLRLEVLRTLESRIHISTTMVQYPRILCKNCSRDAEPVWIIRKEIITLNMPRSHPTVCFGKRSKHAIPRLDQAASLETNFGLFQPLFRSPAAATGIIHTAPVLVSDRLSTIDPSKRLVHLVRGCLAHPHIPNPILYKL
jgi:hypothetical protein